MRFRVLALSIFVCSAATCCAAGQIPRESSLRSNPALDQFKTLAGEWEGKDSHGTTVHATYEALASGVVMERLQAEGHTGMMTMYSLDGDHILAIHFCSEGNQPILRTGPVSQATGKYDFLLERAYGLKSQDDLHMVELVMTLTDSDHFSQVWTNVDHGKRSANTITFTRKK
jgi:hypothetical protein